MAGLHKSQERVDLGKIANRPPSVPKMFLNRVAATPAAEAFRYPANGGWTSVTWKQIGDQVELLAAGLISLGLELEDRVAIATHPTNALPTKAASNASSRQR